MRHKATLLAHKLVFAPKDPNAKQLPADLLERVRAELAAFPDGGAIEDLSAG